MSFSLAVTTELISTCIFAVPSTFCSIFWLISMVDIFLILIVVVFLKIVSLSTTIDNEFTCIVVLTQRIKKIPNITKMHTTNTPIYSNIVFKDWLSEKKLRTKLNKKATTRSIIDQKKFNTSSNTEDT